MNMMCYGKILMLVVVAELNDNPFSRSSYISSRRPLDIASFEQLPVTYHDGEPTAVA